MTNPKKNLIYNITIALVILLLTVAMAYGTSCLHNAYGMNWGALIGTIVTIILFVIAVPSIVNIFDSYKSDKRSKQAEEKLMHLESKYPLALKHKGIRSCSNSSLLFTKEVDIILSMTDGEWSNFEEQLKEKEFAKKERDKNLLFLSNMSKKYPYAFYKIANKRLFDVRLPRPYGLILPGERNIHKIKTINDIENEDPQYARLRSLRGVDDEFIRNTKMMDIVSEASKCVWRKTVALVDLTDRQIQSILRKIDEDSLKKEEEQILSELKEEEIKISFYTNIVGVKERDKYCDSFLIRNNIHDNIYEYLINHIKELDDYIHSQKNMSIEDSRKIQIQKNLSTWGKLEGKPYFFFHYYYPQRYIDINKENEDIRNLIYRFKDGKVDTMKTVANYTAQKLIKTFGIYKLCELAFVCMPEASGQIDPVPWEELFPHYLNLLTDIQNGSMMIKVVKKKIPKHLGGTEPAEYAVKEDFFQGKDVVLFDDIVTTGETIRQSVNFLESNGANVLCIMSLAHTCVGDAPKTHSVQ